MEAHRWAQKRRILFSLKELCQIPGAKSLASAPTIGPSAAAGIDPARSHPGRPGRRCTSADRRPRSRRSPAARTYRDRAIDGPTPAFTADGPGDPTGGRRGADRPGRRSDGDRGAICATSRSFHTPSTRSNWPGATTRTRTSTSRPFSRPSARCSRTRSRSRRSRPNQGRPWPRWSAPSAASSTTGARVTPGTEVRYRPLSRGIRDSITRA